ncbi:MAG: hypothetical protein V1253_07795, partial [Alphaproteobacteria bacterium]|nr:hypothetical protein [Alphaproteobacteria bacterium]
MISVVLGAALLGGGCGFFDEDVEHMEGERISILIGDRELMPDAKAAEVQVRLPRPVSNENWPQAGGDASHVMGHLAAKGSLSPVWEESIGDGTDEELRLLSTPIIA